MSSVVPAWTAPAPWHRDQQRTPGMPDQPVKTETTIRTFDADGTMLSETVTTWVKTDAAGDDSQPCQYL
jgi:hypothetical protein